MGWAGHCAFFDQVLMPKTGETRHFWVQNQDSDELLSAYVNWIFLKLYIITGIKKWFKMVVLIFTEISFYAQNGVNETFLGRKSIFLKFPLNLLIKFFWNCTRWKA